eukprot:SAG22_NODE_7942_length_696_cov_0.845896_1_plen_220_part_10
MPPPAGALAKAMALLRACLAAALFAGVYLLSQHFKASAQNRSGWLAHGVLFVAAVATVVFIPAIRADLEAEGEVAPITDDWVEASRAKYGLSALGFLPDRCLERLPAAFEPWEELVDALPELNKAGKLAAAVEALPVLETAGRLTSGPELRRAGWVLAALGHSYMNGRNVPWAALQGAGAVPPAAQQPAAAEEDGQLRRLPAGVAVPWFAVSGRLGIPPV